MAVKEWDGTEWVVRAGGSGGGSLAAGDVTVDADPLTTLAQAAASLERALDDQQDVDEIVDQVLGYVLLQLAGLDAAMVNGMETILASDGESQPAGDRQLTYVRLDDDLTLSSVTAGSVGPRVRVWTVQHVSDTPRTISWPDDVTPLGDAAVDTTLNGMSMFLLTSKYPEGWHLRRIWPLPASGSAVWGSIGGTLGDQTDLAAVLPPDPSAAPNGHVVTVNSGAYTLAAVGGGGGVDIATLLQRPPKSGEWITPPFATAHVAAITLSGNTGQSFGAGGLSFTPLLIRSETTVDAVGVRLATAATDAGAYLDIAAGTIDETGTWTRLWHAGQIDITATPNLLLATFTPRVVEPGVLWMLVKGVAATTAGTNPAFYGSRLPSFGVGTENSMSSNNLASIVGATATPGLASTDPVPSSRATTVAHRAFNDVIRVGLRVA